MNQSLLEFRKELKATHDWFKSSQAELDIMNQIINFLEGFSLNDDKATSQDSVKQKWGRQVIEVFQAINKIYV